VSYEAAREREDSLDRLLDWPCQRQLIGDVTDKSILDLGCGSGAKAIQFANEGAARVVGVDISDAFISALTSASTPPQTSWIHADIDQLHDIDELVGEQFDVITVLCSSLGSDRATTLRIVAELLAPDGFVVLYMAHPLRFSLQRSLREGTPLGRSYFDRSPFSYPSHWDPEVILTDEPKTFSDVINAVSAAGLYIEESQEPELPEDLALKFPDKRAWLDENVGAWGMRLRRLR
jgi:SAM-dependent methyltransferase